MGKERVTDDEANAALHQLVGREDPPEAAVEPVTETPEPSTTVEPEEPAEPQAADPVEPVAEDDIESLRARNTQLESDMAAAKKDQEDRIAALRDRNQANERILRDRYLRKATVTDKALKALQAARDQGISEEAVDAIIREAQGTMHGGVAQPLPEQPVPQPQPVATNEDDRALVLNSFLNEQQMSSAEAEKFGNWVQTEAENAMSANEKAVAHSSLDGFLRLAHNRYREGIEAKEAAARDDAVGAVRSVQQTQRQAARAATVSTGGAPLKQAPAAEQTDTRKLSQADVASLLKQSVQQYR